MIRLEVVLKSRYGSSVDGSQCERTLRRELLETVAERVEADDLEIVRVQYLGPKARRSNSTKD